MEILAVKKERSQKDFVQVSAFSGMKADGHIWYFSGKKLELFPQQERKECHCDFETV